ncbi:hypothetical protein [Acetanaerobacterium elongatum]|uniref:Uncharacterized protein n=1 Tax=Acetanaerobacterium elongatum TaxID=258515 RepID=A0A1H0G4D7_9FIRM|nr:hypothetical protein [Acetanaerobacterium elongatum]SDO01736.1 hypothetical protein SAMN05192585_14714 [Acetanaerobacterium elongatum]
MSMLAAEVICLVVIILAGVAVSVLAGLIIERSERKAYKRQTDTLAKPDEQPHSLEKEETDTYPP